MHLIIDTPGGSLTVRNACFCIGGKERKPQLVHPARVTAIILQQYAMLSTAAAGLASQYNIPLSLMHPAYPSAGLFAATAPGLALLRRRQAICRGMPVPTRIACGWIRQKMEGQMANIRWLLTRLKKGASAIRNAEKLFKKITRRLSNPGINNEQAIAWQGAEAYWAALYWKNMALAINNREWFCGRQKRNCTDRLNPVLNYAYALLRHLVEAEVLSLGLDPSLGLLHSDGRGKQPLLYDLMEVWRPMVDRWLLDWLLANPAANRWQQTQQGIRLSKEGRKDIATLFFEKAMATRGRGRKALSTQIGQECLTLQKHLQQTPYEELLTSFIENYYGKTTPPCTQ